MERGGVHGFCVLSNTHGRIKKSRVKVARMYSVCKARKYRACGCADDGGSLSRKVERTGDT